MRGLLEVVSEKEAKEMVRYTIRLQMEGLWENGLDLLHALERDAAFMINGAPRIDDPEGKRSTAQSKIMGEVITTCLATDAGEMEAVCINVVYYVLEGRKPEKWTKADTPERTTERLRSKKGVKTLEEKDKEAFCQDGFGYGVRCQGGWGTTKSIRCDLSELRKEEHLVLHRRGPHDHGTMQPSEFMRILGIAVRSRKSNTLRRKQ